MVKKWWHSKVRKDHVQLMVEEMDSKVRQPTMQLAIGGGTAKYVKRGFTKGRRAAIEKGQNRDSANERQIIQPNSSAARY